MVGLGILIVLWSCLSLIYVSIPLSSSPLLFSSSLDVAVRACHIVPAVSHRLSHRHSLAAFFVLFDPGFLISSSSSSSLLPPLAIPCSAPHLSLP